MSGNLVSPAGLDDSRLLLGQLYGDGLDFLLDSSVFICELEETVLDDELIEASVKII